MLSRKRLTTKICAIHCVDTCGCVIIVALCPEPSADIPRSDDILALCSVIGNCVRPSVFQIILWCSSKVEKKKEKCILVKLKKSIYFYFWLSFLYLRFRKLAFLSLFLGNVAREVDLASFLFFSINSILLSFTSLK